MDADYWLMDLRPLRWFVEHEVGIVQPGQFAIAERYVLAGWLKQTGVTRIFPCRIYEVTDAGRYALEEATRNA